MMICKHCGGSLIYNSPSYEYIMPKYQNGMRLLDSQSYWCDAATSKYPTDKWLRPLLPHEPLEPADLIKLLKKHLHDL